MYNYITEVSLEKSGILRHTYYDLCMWIWFSDKPQEMPQYMSYKY